MLNLITGNSRPRVFDSVPEVTTTKKRATANTGAKRTTTKKTPAVKASKPVGITKKKATPVKKPTVATKVIYIRLVLQYITNSIIGQGSCQEGRRSCYW
jgi:hypothetical protein